MLSLSALRHILYCLFCICIFVFVNLTYWKIILISLLNSPLFTNIPHVVKCIFKCIFKKRIIQNCIFKNSLLKLLASKVLCIVFLESAFYLSKTIPNYVYPSFASLFGDIRHRCPRWFVSFFLFQYVRTGALSINSTH